MKLKSLFITGLLSAVFGLGGAWLFHSFLTEKPKSSTLHEFVPAPSPIGHYNLQQVVDFQTAAKRSTPGVVYIKTTATKSAGYNPWDWFFFNSERPVTGSGSGVIISKKGLVVTNNHVINDADEIKIITNQPRRAYSATVIGRDPSTDLALLKIDAQNLPAIEIGNSDDVKIGQWVLAVGNPYNLTSTVTAGIVSAKGRNIHLLDNQFPVESFIQTDAAINPGNSGGALVDENGRLVGINTAILSKTGGFSGYGFAIPINMVKKIIEDIELYGQVQRAFPGLEVSDFDPENFQGHEMDSGVLVTFVASLGPAAAAGVKENDIILSINGINVRDKSVFTEQIAYHRPGDKVNLLIKRGSKTQTIAVELFNKEGSTGLLKRQFVYSQLLGAEFEAISKLEKERYGLKYGVKVTNIRSGRIRQLNIPEGFIIVAINNVTYTDAQQLVNDFERISGRVMLQGINENGTPQYLNFIVR